MSAEAGPFWGLESHGKRSRARHPEADTIVVGASAGGLGPLANTGAGLAGDPPAAVFIVLHIGIRSHLVEILGKKTDLQVIPAKSGAIIREGTITVAPAREAPPIHDGHMPLRRGPRENMARPAIDPLFRTAAASAAVQVIGVVLSGGLNDGTAGLRAIKRCGGLAVVRGRRCGGPLHGAKRIASCRCRPCRHGRPDGALAERPRANAGGPTTEVPLDIRLEATIAAQELATMCFEARLGDLSPFNCPRCNGVLSEINDGSMLRYRCHVGHAYTAESVLSGRDGEVDRMLESLLRSHQERAALVRRMAKRERSLQNNSLAARLKRGRWNMSMMPRWCANSRDMAIRLVETKGNC